MKVMLLAQSSHVYGQDFGEKRPPKPLVLSLRATRQPLISAPMAEALTGASRAAIQHNLAWMEAHCLIREMTRQGRYRMWRARN